MSLPSDIEPDMVPRRGSIVTTTNESGDWLVIGFVVSLLKTELVLRQTVPDSLSDEPRVIRSDTRTCLIVSMPLNTGRTTP
jgi:hypothetical protein